MALRDQETYRVGARVAQGGMGEVFVAWRIAGPVRRPYALKRLRAHLREDPSCRRMFLEEARVASMLRHANAVPVLDAGVDDQGPFLVMDYVESVDLGRVLRGSEVPPAQLTVRAMAQVARALHAAHVLRTSDGRPAGLIHRDLSPQNILLGFDGEARLTDFGIARAVQSESESTAGVLKGKLGYMAPELLRFEPATVQSDLFAFGVVLFECLAGRRLYTSSDPRETARRITQDPPPDLYDEWDRAPASLVDLLLRLLAKEPAHRPDTAAAAVDVLDEALAEMRLEEGPVETRSWLRERFEPPDIGLPPEGNAWKTGAEPPAASRRGGAKWLLIPAAALLAGGLAVGLGTHPEPSSTTTPLAGARPSDGDSAESAGLGSALATRRAADAPVSEPEPEPSAAADSDGDTAERLPSPRERRRAPGSPRAVSPAPPFERDPGQRSAASMSMGDAIAPSGAAPSGASPSGDRVWRSWD